MHMKEALHPTVDAFSYMFSAFQSFQTSCSCYCSYIFMPAVMRGILYDP